MNPTFDTITGQTKLLLDSGNPQEYTEIAKLANDHDTELWGATTNPTLIAKSASWRTAGKKVSQKEAFLLQKNIVEEILSIVPGSVSAEVYADENTTADEMIEQGRDISSWHKRVVVKLPTTIEGLKARTTLRKENIAVNNTLVFSQEQIYALCLHEKLIQQEVGPTNELVPPCISPFVGRLDDTGVDGMDVVTAGMKLKWEFHLDLPSSKLAIWMLEASVRNVAHMKRGFAANVELITAPAKAYRQWFALTKAQQDTLDTTTYAKDLASIPLWKPSPDILAITTMEQYMDALTSGKLSLQHPLTDKGLQLFTQDWKSILK